MQVKTSPNFSANLFNQKIYSMSEVKEFLDQKLPSSKKRNGAEYYNVAASFDIETSSFFTPAGEKNVCMYIWMFGLNGRVIIGRTWDEFYTLYDELVFKLRTEYDKKHLVVYVHNLAYEFQFIRYRFEWSKMFALKPREPVYCTTAEGIEFRCSYILTASNLDSVGKNLLKYIVYKKVGQLDYNQIRHKNTPLTDEELEYCVNDVKVVMACIQEKIEEEKYIHKIPITSTGYARRYSRNYCLKKESKYDPNYYWYRDLMSCLTMTPAEYQIVRRAFQGGFTHTCPSYSGDTVHGAGSIDFTSSYPYVMVAEPNFPMGKGCWVKITSMKQLLTYCRTYCCIFDIRFENIQSKVEFDNYISVSHCRHAVNVVSNNGRLYSADSIITTLTELDFAIIQKMYEWEKVYIGSCIIYAKGYLPTPLVKSILDLYKKKTELKGNTNDDPYLEGEYMRSKQLLNSIFGMTCTNIIRDDIGYAHNDWTTTPKDLAEEIEKYNNSKNRFLFYPWGIYVTALARFNLMGGIWNFSNAGTNKPCDYIYSDTDSIKCLNLRDHMDYIERYNNQCRKKLYAAMDHHRLPYEMVEPMDVKGNKHLMGVWDIEDIDDMDNFRALGAKRYMYTKEGKIHLTVSGLNKRVAVPWLEKHYKKNEEILAAFKDGFYLPAEATGKLTHTYIDFEMEGEVTDYLGNKAHYHEKSGVHLYPQDFELSISRDYSDFLHMILANGGIF